MTEHFKKYVSFRNAFFALSLISLFAFPLLSRDAGMSGDEELHFNQSEKVYNYFKTRGDDKSAIHTPGTHLKYYGQAFDNLTTILIKWFGIEDVYQFRHLCNSLVGWATIFIAGLLAVSLAGYRAGFITILLFLVSARFIGHSWNNLKDIPFALGYLASIYFIILFIKAIKKAPYSYNPPTYNKHCLCYRNTNRRNLTLLLPTPIHGLYFANDYLGNRNLFTKKVIVKTSLLVIGIIVFAYFLGIILWPFALESPLKNPWISYKSMTQFPTTLRQIFEGQVYWSDQLPWYYLLKYMVLTIPTVVLAGLWLFVGFSKKIFENKNWIFTFFLIFSVVFPLFFIIAGGSNVYGAWRHVIFVYPPLVILSAMGIDIAFTFMKKKNIKIISLLILLILFTHPLRFMIKNHPYEYLYFNEFSDGLKGAYGKYETDYYYHSIREASEWLQSYLKENNKYGPEKIEVALNFPAGDWFFRHNKDDISTKYLKYYSRGNQKWDYAIVANSYIHPYQLQENIWPPENTIHTVEADGVPICAILERKTLNDYNGYISLQNSQLHESKKLLLNALTIDPGNEAVLVNLSAAYIYSDKLDSAAIVVNKCLNICPDYEPAIHQMAKIKQINGDTEEAIALFKQNLENNYKYFPSYIGLAKLYFETGEDKLAILELKKCLSINPYYKPALLLLGNHYKSQGKTELAEKYLNSAKKL